jgi:hypothetical protein
MLSCLFYATLFIYTCQENFYLTGCVFHELPE